MRRSLRVQLILAIAAVSLIVFGLFAFSVTRSHHRTLISHLGEQASELSETIKSSTRHAMLLNRADDVHRIIDAVGRQQGIEKIRVYNKEGEVIYSPDKSLVGSMVDKQAEACFVCHAVDAPLERLSTTQRNRIFKDPSGVRYISNINPIYNEPSCSTADCHAHPPTQKVLGVLDVTMSLAEVDRRLVADRGRATALVAAAVAAIGIVIWLFFHFLVGKPVDRLLAATRAVAGGDLSYRLTARRDDELGQLERSFGEMTERLEEAQKQIYQSDRLASIGRLAAGVAHEINNPLTGVLSYASFLLKRAPEGSETRQDLETVVRETKRCREIVQGLLDFSRQQPARKTAVDLNEAIANALEIVDNQLSFNNIRVTRALHGDLPPVMADRNQIAQVLINLLVNASDAIGPGGGEIFISTDVAENDSGRFAQIKLADTGCGIPEENMGHLFEPFFTTKQSQGTGLGLAVVWGILETHGGTIKVESKVDRGTTFTILLPVEQAIPGVIEAKADARTG